MVLDDNQKIGVGLIALGIGFITLGVILFLDSGLIAIGNTLFLAGICFSIGIRRALSLFTRRDRIAGTVIFFFGILLIILRRVFIGIIFEFFGFINLFGNFFPTILMFLRQIPFLNKILDAPGIKQTLDYIVSSSTTSKPKYSV